jgi:hypothetical protein
MSCTARLALLITLVGAACHGTDPSAKSCGAITSAFRFPDGSPDGHPDPAGARAAGQARAGRITSAAMVHSPPDVRFPVHVGTDFLLANDKIALYIEGARPSDGYNPFGGEIAAIEPVGDDGLPRGISQYGEGFYAAGGMVVSPDKVTVLNDGSDGGPAIVRSRGLLQIAPFLEGYAFLFGDVHPMPAALDYILAPGAEKVTLRLSIQNFDATKVDLTAAQIVAFLMNRSVTFTPEHGFAPLENIGAWLGWEAQDGHALAARIVKPLAFTYLAAVEGAQLFTSNGAVMEACQSISFDYVELIPAAPGIDALREAVRRVDGEPAWRAIAGTLKDDGGAPIAGAHVHATRPDGSYLTRATTDADGKYLLHAPPEPVQLQVSARGLPAPTPVDAAASTGTVDLVVASLGKISIVATEAGSGAALPARVQVFPTAAPQKLPPSFGEDDPGDGRVHLVFAVDGKAQVTVPAGTYRVVVSHGYEYEMFDQMVTVDAGQTQALAPVLERSVATTGALSADFHIHTYYSLDAPDPIDYKVRGALAEGIELPCASDHEFVIDFEPIVEQLGATAWARGLASEELSTSTFGHFGLVPMEPQPDQVNRGTVPWADIHPPEIFSRVRKVATDPALIVNHPQSTAAFKGYFADVLFDPVSATGDPTDWSDNFDAIEVCNTSDFASNRNGSIKNWFSLLEHGKIVFATGSSDSHRMTTDVVGYPRNYLIIGTDVPQQATPAQVRDAIKKGTSTLSGGLYMTVSAPGGIGPGGTVASTAGAMVSFDVVVQSPGWLSAKTLEVIVDGQTVKMIDLAPSVVPGPGKRYEATVDLPADGAHHFVVFHAASDIDLAPVHPGKKPFAMSNPIFY